MVKNNWTSNALKPQQIFEVASLSKPVLAYGVLKLVDEGLVDLDSPINQYLKDAPESVTIRQALTHTSKLKQVGRSGYTSGSNSESANSLENESRVNFANQSNQRGQS
ncbi:MAG: CubicO group peptidase (beta-lactamase class C family) [Paraglaciecola sp.]